MPEIIILVALALGIVAANINWKKLRYSKDLDFPAPPQLRKDLYFGFYGCSGEQVTETRGAVNLHMESQWDGFERAIQNIRTTDAAVMLDISQQLFVRTHPTGKFVMRSDANLQLQNLFNRLRMENALHKVKVLYPVDEPNNTVADVGVLVQAISLTRTISALYSELQGCKLAVIYAADKPFICQEYFDWIGFDDYDMKSHVLVGEKYQALKASLQTSQQIMVIPGAAYGQNPVPFVNFAQSNPEVSAVLAFLWCDGREADVGAAAARSNGMAAAYLAAGKSIVVGTQP